MKVAAILWLLLAVSLSQAETLMKDDLVGFWETNRPTTQGEKSNLLIRADFSSEFIRDFPKNKDQHFSGVVSNVNCVGEICIFSYLSNDHGYRYRIALSGWKINDSAMLFGTLYMYEDGKLFNGLPITFEKKVNK